MFKKQKKKKRLDKNTVRVIKIGKEALFEYIYEHFIDETEMLFDVDPANVVNSFDISFENGEFICCIYDDDENSIRPFDYADELDLQKVMEKIPDTTSSLYNSGDSYRDFTKEELLKLSE